MQKATGRELEEPADMSLVEPRDQQAQKRHRSAVSVSGELQIHARFRRTGRRGKRTVTEQHPKRAGRHSSEGATYVPVFKQAEESAVAHPAHEDGALAAADLDRTRLLRKHDAESSEDVAPLVPPPVHLVVAGAAHDAVPGSEEPKRREVVQPVGGKPVHEVAGDRHQVGIERIDAVDDPPEPRFPRGA